MKSDVCRPMALFDLDNHAAPRAVLGPGRVFVLNGALWVWESVGCVLCHNDETPSCTLVGLEGDDTHFCLEHGPLIEVPYRLTELREISIGSITRLYEDEDKDGILFPTSMSEEERNELITEYLDSAETGAGESEGQEA